MSMWRSWGKDFRLLWMAQIGSLLGSWFNTIAVLNLVSGLAGSGVQLSLFFLARSVPAVVLAPFLGALADRFPRKQTLIAMDLVRVVLALGYILVRRPEDLWLAYLTAFLMSIADAVFNPTWKATIPSVIGREQLQRANGVLSSTQALTMVLGAALGNTVSALLSAKAAFVVNSVSFAYSALLIMATSIPATQQLRKAASFLGDVWAGVKAVRKLPIALGCILLGVSWGFAGGGYHLLVTYMGSKVYGLGAAGIALLYVIDGVGVFVGGSLVSTLKGQNMSRTLTLFGVSYVLQGLLFAFFAGAPILLVGAVFLLGMRVASGIIIPIDSFLLQSTVPSELHGRVFSLHSATYGGVMQLSVALTGLMLDQIGHLTGVVMGLAACAFGLLWLSVLKRLRMTTEVGG